MTAGTPYKKNEKKPKDVQAVQLTIHVNMKKAFREMQTLRTGYSKAEPQKFSPRCRPPSRGRGTTII